VGVLVLSDGPDAAVVEESPGVAFAMRLWGAGYRVKVFDPTALEAAGALLGTKAAAASMEACAREAGVLAITTRWAVFSSLDPVSLRRAGKLPVVVDCWRVVPK
jgi:UDP-glucose 6-dehydrogenase